MSPKVIKSRGDKVIDDGLYDIADEAGVDGLLIAGVSTGVRVPLSFISLNMGI